MSGALFCLVYGFSNAATHNWHTPSTYGFLIAGVALLIAFAFWQGRAANPLLPPRVVLDRNRGGAYLSMLIAFAGMFGVFLFLTYYLQQTLGYSPVVTGFAPRVTRRPPAIRPGAPAPGRSPCGQKFVPIFYAFFAQIEATKLGRDISRGC